MVPGNNSFWEIRGFGNPEMGLISAKILVGTDKIGTRIFPFLYLVGLFLAWKQRPINFDIFQYMVGMSFLILSLPSA